jgi:hypothetical protein
MKIIYHLTPPPESLSEARRAGFFSFFVINPPRGRPFAGWRHFSYPIDREVPIPASYQNNLIFIENIQKILNAYQVPYRSQEIDGVC